MRIDDSETNKCKKKLMLEPKEFEQSIEYALANGVTVYRLTHGILMIIQ